MKLQEVKRESTVKDRSNTLVIYVKECPFRRCTWDVTIYNRFIHFLLNFVAETSWKHMFYAATYALWVGLYYKLSICSPGIQVYISANPLQPWYNYYIASKWYCSIAKDILVNVLLFSLKFFNLTELWTKM